MPRSRAGSAIPERAAAAPVVELYQRLLAAYGPQGWWPGGDDPLEVVVGAILTQNTAWANVERALARLRDAEALSLRALRALPLEALARLILPSGTYAVKAVRLKAFVSLVDEAAGGDLAALLDLPADDLRDRLLATHGIGPETADAILLYAASRPAFVVDAYTRRIADRVGLVPSTPTYDGYSRLFSEALPPDPELLGEYHALLVEHAKRRCTKRAPRCGGCPLADVCASSGAETAS